ncbi:hypothetical protein M9434_006194 [Picochlorum sp. BPE23]|nr:hypothetical protein M9434_006194 [Picochlorum sp. BPE23]
MTDTTYMVKGVQEIGQQISKTLTSQRNSKKKKAPAPSSNMASILVSPGSQSHPLMTPKLQNPSFQSDRGRRVRLGGMPGHASSQSVCDDKASLVIVLVIWEETRARVADCRGNTEIPLLHTRRIVTWSQSKDFLQTTTTTTTKKREREGCLNVTMALQQH